MDYSGLKLARVRVVNGGYEVSEEISKAAKAQGYVVGAFAASCRGMTNVVLGAV